MIKTHKVSVVMPNLNGRELLEKNLPKLLEAKKNPRNNILEIILIDDASWDESVNFVKANYPEVKLIRHKINRGFSASVNTGVRSAKGDLILLINTDVIPDRDFLVSVLPHFDDPKMFAVSLHEKGYGYAKGAFYDGYIQLAAGEETDKFHNSFYVSGGSGIFSRKLWVELGGMDEKLLSPFYWEDIDLCYRAQKRGFLLGWEPNGNVVHKHESTISKLSKSYVARVRERNQLLCIWKNITSPSLTRKHIVGVFKRLIKQPGYIRIVLMAMARFGIAMAKRRREIRESKVSDEVIFSRFTGRS